MGRELLFPNIHRNAGLESHWPGLGHVPASGSHRLAEVTQKLHVFREKVEISPNQDADGGKEEQT